MLMLMLALSLCTGNDTDMTEACAIPAFESVVYLLWVLAHDLQLMRRKCLKCGDLDAFVISWEYLFTACPYVVISLIGHV